MRKTEPSPEQVAETVDEIIRDASKRVAQDYDRRMKRVELRLLTQVYVRRALDLLMDDEQEWSTKGGQLWRL